MYRWITSCALVLLIPALAGACGGAQAAARPAPSSTSAASTTTAATRPATTAPDAQAQANAQVEAQVRRAYLQSWDDYAWALWRLDPRGLERTYADGALAFVQNEVAGRVRDRRLSRVSVTHDITIVMLGPDHAAVADHIMDSSTDVDADTGADREGPHTDPDYFQMTLERFGRTWKVVFYV